VAQKKRRQSVRRGRGARGRTRPAAAVAAEILVVLNGIRRLDRGLRLAAREVQAATGLSAAQLFVLEHLTDSPAASLSDLAARTMTDRSSVSVVVDRLVAGRLASRVASREDRRRAEVRITAAGRAILDRAPPAPTDVLLTGLRGLSAASVRRLGTTLAELNAILGFREAHLLFSDAE
jgi:DNA-binding MarR family transcriptional regulator